jgi:Tfp pilus assembly protein PilE
LIELVVVIAVLAVLTAIALPNFLGVSEDASVRTAQQAALNAFKECKVFWAGNKRDAQGTSTQREFQVPAVTDWKIVAVDSGVGSSAQFNSAITESGSEQPAAGTKGVACFDTGKSSRDVYAIPEDTQKFSSFAVLADGEKKCKTGGDTAKETFNTGCDATAATTVQTGWK